jgi:hypothetical protein
MKLSQLFTIAFSCLLIGCTSVVSEKTIGTEPTELKPSEWNGTWGPEGEEETFMVKVLDKKLGKVNIGIVRKNDGKFDVTNVDGFLTESNDKKYLNLILSQILEGKDKENIEKKYPNEYCWFRYKRKEDTIIFWYPDYKEIKNLIQKNKLSGLVDNDIIKLEKPFEDKIPFNFENFLILRRVLKK